MSNLISFIEPSNSQRGHEKAKESYFTYNNPTVGTGVALNADPTVIAANEAAVIIDNSASRSSEENHHVILDYIKMTCTVSGANMTKARLAFYIDNINRYSSGGTELTGKSSSYDTLSGYADRTPKGKVYVGDLTAAAANSAKHIGTVLLRNDTQTAPCFTVDDVYFLSHFVEPGFEQDAATAPVIYKKEKIPYIVLGPGSSLIIAPLFPNAATTPPQFEFEIATVEKGHPISV